VLRNISKSSNDDLLVAVVAVVVVCLPVSFDFSLKGDVGQSKTIHLKKYIF
jgi:hypothetical protein